VVASAAPSQQPAAAAATLSTTMPAAWSRSDHQRSARANRVASTHAVLNVV